MEALDWLKGRCLDYLTPAIAVSVGERIPDTRTFRSIQWPCVCCKRQTREQRGGTDTLQLAHSHSPPFARLPRHRKDPQEKIDPRKSSIIHWWNRLPNYASSSKRASRSRGRQNIECIKHNCIQKWTHRHGAYIYIYLPAYPGVLSKLRRTRVKRLFNRDKRHFNMPIGATVLVWVSSTPTTKHLLHWLKVNSSRGRNDVMWTLITISFSKSFPRI